jgi:hypothetical protein
MDMKLGVALLVLAGWVAGQRVYSQAPAPAPKPSDTQQQKPPASNPFPEDTTDVPLMPNGNAPTAPEPPAGGAVPSTLPKGDVDPVRSPDDPPADADTDAQGFSSSSGGLANVMPPPDTDIDTHSGKNGRGAPPPEHQETAQEDEQVGDYYLDRKNWRAALSRYESAVVLDPENPDVYWGLGEARRHLGQFAEAKAAYEKLVEYDPDSKHGKEAKKLLKSPELANAASVAKP